jgi:endonuclease/exonuclease/phosphatase family metal-dependent hydrolase
LNYNFKNHYRALLVVINVIIIASCSKGQTSDTNNVQQNLKDTVKTTNRVLKVMSYNIHRGNPPNEALNIIDIQAIANVIKAQNPDLVSLNEVDVNTNRSGKNLDEAKEIGRLTGLYSYFAKAMDYDGGQYGDAVLSRYPILDSMRYPIPFAIPGSEPRDLCMITIEKNGKKILFASTHLDHLSSEENRLLQANFIVDQILPTLKNPLILGGDFNAQPTSQPLLILKKKFTLGCSGIGCPFTFPYNNPDRTIDYIMYLTSDMFSFLNYNAINNTAYPFRSSKNL